MTYESTTAVTLKPSPLSPEAGSLREHHGQPEGAGPGKILPVPGVRQRAAGSGRVQRLELSCKNHFTQKSSVEKYSHFLVGGSSSPEVKLESCITETEVFILSFIYREIKG